jgi:hypothetical protein
VTLPHDRTFGTMHVSMKPERFSTVYRITRKGARGRRSVWTFYNLHDVLQEIRCHEGPVRIRVSRANRDHKEQP